MDNTKHKIDLLKKDIKIAKQEFDYHSKEFDSKIIKLLLRLK